MKKVLVPIVKIDQNSILLTLVDGGILKVTLPITNVVREQNDDGSWCDDANGFPQYGIMSGQPIVGFERLPMEKTEKKDLN